MKESRGTEMSWGKVNLVTEKDKTGFYDLWKCSDCGFKKKYYGLYREGECPKCIKKSKIKIKQDVNGSWGDLNHETTCQWCGSLFVLCPKDGHPNSKYWRLQISENEILKVCPKGCLEDGSGKNIAI
ncbi:MAG: hypothetical protein ABIG69_06420 [Bacteroidota bacterium]